MHGERKYPSTAILHTQAYLREHFSDDIARKVLIRAEVAPGITPTDRVAAIDVPRTIQSACEIVGDIDLGFKIGAEFTMPGFLAFYIARSSQTVGEALKDAGEFLTTNTSLFTVNRVAHKDRFDFVIVLQSRDLLKYPRWVEFALTGAHAQLRDFSTVDFQPTAVHLGHSRRSPGEDVQDWFGSPILTEQRSNMLEYPNEVLVHDVKYHDPYLHDILVTQARALMGATVGSGPDIVSKVDLEIMRQWASGTPSLDGISRELGMSTRSISRKLRERGTTFREMLHGARMRLACQYLKETDLKIQEISYALGYAEQSAFTTSFRNEFGMSPKDFRKTS